MPTIDTGLTEGDLLTELAARIANEDERIRETDVTVQGLMAATGKDRSPVERFLRQEVDAGRLVCVSVIGRNGRRVNAYRRRAEA